MPDRSLYEKLAGVLGALPNGFPRTKSGVELRLLDRDGDKTPAWPADEHGPARHGPLQKA